MHNSDEMGPRCRVSRVLLRDQISLLDRGGLSELLGGYRADLYEYFCELKNLLLVEIAE